MTRDSRSGLGCSFSSTFVKGAKSDQVILQRVDRYFYLFNNNESPTLNVNQPAEIQQQHDAIRHSAGSSTIGVLVYQAVEATKVVSSNEPRPESRW